MVAAHRVEGNAHGSALFLLFLHRGSFATLGVMVTAVPAHHVGQDRVTAAVAVGVLDAFDVQVAPPFALPGMGRAPLRYSHGSDRFLKRRDRRLPAPPAVAVNQKGTANRVNLAIQRLETTQRTENTEKGLVSGELHQGMANVAFLAFFRVLRGFRG
jgi:hypothetical protein